MRSAFQASVSGLPVMMGVTFASVGPMLSMAGSTRYRFAWHLRLGDRLLESLASFGRPLHQAGCCRCFRPVVTGDHHHGDRHFADARRDQLGPVAELPTLTKVV